jgi:uncharacterized protein (TIRG00374 family)
MAATKIDEVATTKRRGLKRHAGTAARIVVSAGMILLLVWIARKQHVARHIREVPPGGIAAAAGFTVLAWLVNSLRWNLLLRVAGVKENSRTLASLYFIGMFFSQLLPTGTGGDAVRMWDLYRRGHKPAAVVVATLQERFMGLGVSMLIGLIAVAFYFRELPPYLRPLLVGLPFVAVAAVAVFLYPRIPLAIAGHIGQRSIFKRLAGSPIVHRITATIRPAANLPALTPRRLLPIVGVTMAGVLLSIAVWWALGVAAGMTVPFGGFCLVVPLVWVIAMAPSLGGAGLREGGFVALMLVLFAVPKDRSITVAALYLIVQLATACLGGLLLLARVAGGSWKSPAPQLKAE